MTAPRELFLDKRVYFWDPEPVKVSPCVYSFSGCRKLEGRVIRSVAAEPVGPGRVPDFKLLVRGDLGGEKWVSVTRNMVQVIR